MFVRTGKHYDISLEEKIYSLPERTTHVGLRQGKIGFFRFLGGNPEESLLAGHKSSSNRRYFQVKESANYVSFPDAKKTRGGWEYGNPKWFKEPPVVPF